MKKCAHEESVVWHDVRLLNRVANAFFALFVLAVLFAVLNWFARQPVFMLSVISVREASGRELNHVNALTVSGVAVPRIRGSFFTVNLEEVREAFRAVPWVRDATVRRVWPNGLMVFVEEHRPLGKWGDDGQLLSAKGDVFTANIAEAEEEVRLLNFYAPPGSQKEVLLRYEELRKGFSGIRLEPVVVELSERYAWKVTLNNGITVLFGREQGVNTVASQMARLVAVYPRMSAQIKRIRRIDMRYPNGLAVRADDPVPDMRGK